MFDISRNKDRKWHTICKTRKDAANYVGACRGSVWKWNCQGSLGSTHGDSGGIDFLLALFQGKGIASELKQTFKSFDILCIYMHSNAHIFFSNRQKYAIYKLYSL